MRCPPPPLVCPCRANKRVPVFAPTLRNVDFLGSVDLVLASSSLFRGVVGDPGHAHPADAVTTAISSVIIVGALIALPPPAAQSPNARMTAVVLASITIFVGFASPRDLAMYQKKMLDAALG